MSDVDYIIMIWMSGAGCSDPGTIESVNEAGGNAAGGNDAGGNDDTGWWW